MGNIKRGDFIDIKIRAAGIRGKPQAVGGKAENQIRVFFPDQFQCFYNRLRVGEGVPGTRDTRYPEGSLPGLQFFMAPSR
jgi:hypothetical protein